MLQIVIETLSDTRNNFKNYGHFLIERCNLNLVQIISNALNVQDYMCVGKCTINEKWGYMLIYARVSELYSQ